MKLPFNNSLGSDCRSTLGCESLQYSLIKAGHGFTAARNLGCASSLEELLLSLSPITNPIVIRKDYYETATISCLHSNNATFYKFKMYVFL